MAKKFNLGFGLTALAALGALGTIQAARADSLKGSWKLSKIECVRTDAETAHTIGNLLTAQVGKSILSSIDVDPAAVTLRTTIRMQGLRCVVVTPGELTSSGAQARFKQNAAESLTGTSNCKDTIGKMGGIGSLLLPSGGNAAFTFKRATGTLTLQAGSIKDAETDTELCSDSTLTYKKQP